MSKIAALALLALFLTSPDLLRAAGQPTHLRINNLTNTLGLDAANVDNLRFGWRVPEGMQSAYQIRLSNGWDTGKIESNQQNGIRYTGPSLSPHTAYSWKVKLWIDGTETGWAEAGFETAILNPGRDWKGMWVGSGPLTQGQDGKNIAHPFNLIRQSFQLPAGKKVIRARAYVAAMHGGHSFYGFRVNGVPPADILPLKEGFYTFDIAPYLHAGTNVFGALFGNTRPKQNDAPNTLNRFLCDIDVWLDDGSQITLGTGAATKGTQAGPILSAHEFDGEQDDSRKEIPWSEPSFDDAGWQACQSAAAGKPDTAVLDLVKTVEILSPASVATPKPGMVVFDVGTQISGRQILKVTAKAGTKIQFRFAERLNQDGTIDRSTILNGLPAEQIDLYICKDGEQTWEPQLTMHGFRYMEVTGVPGTPKPDTIRFRRLAGDIVGERAAFECSNESLNRLHQAFHDTELANAVFEQTDCNQRGERAPWAADAFCVSEASMSYFDMPHFLQEKWINTANRKVGPHGEANFILRGPAGGYALLWGSHVVRIPWDYWNAYGDRAYLAPCYARAKQFADCCIHWYDKLDEVTCDSAKKKPGEITKYNSREDWLIDAETPWKVTNGSTRDNGFRVWGDWCRPDGRWYNNDSFINSATYYLVVKQTARMAEAVGKTADAEYYQDIAEKIRTAINAKWLVENTGQTCYCDNDQTPNAMALHYGIVPEAKRAAVVASLVTHIRSLDNHLSTGALGTLSLVPALSLNGRDDVVFDLAVQKTLPSWGGMLAEGPGTFWEHFTEKGGSKCHPFLGGSIAAWLHQSVAGIRPAKPGYEEIEIRPVPSGDVSFCKATVPTVRGPVISDWKIKGGIFDLTICIPGNTTANVYLPGEAQPRRVGPGMHSFTKEIR